MIRVVLLLALLVCAGPVLARTTGCDEIDGARARGMSPDEIKSSLQTTTGKILICEQVTAIRDRIAAHRVRAEGYRARLERRFAP